MKKKLLIGLGAFYTLLIAAVVAVVIYFWSYIGAVDWSLVNMGNIRALYQGLTESPEVTQEKKKAMDSKRSEEIRNYVSVDLREYTDEEKRQIESGEKTETEILAQIITETVEKEESEKPDTDTEIVDKPVQNTDTENKENTPTNKESADKIVARHVSALYSIQGEFEGRVASLVSSAKNWVAAYKKANPGITWRDAKVAGVQHFSATASSIESECYARVDAQIAQLEADLVAIGADTSIVATIKATAYSEMESRKAQIVQEGYSKVNK